MKNNSVLIIVVVAVLVGAGGFFSGMKYQQSKRQVFNRQFGNVPGQAGQAGRMGGRMEFRPVNGEIISSDEKSITVKSQDGSSKIVLFSDKTSINKAADATKEDLKTGERVAVFGIENSDGSITAQTIQLNPILRGIPSDLRPTGAAQ